MKNLLYSILLGVGVLTAASSYSYTVHAVNNNEGLYMVFNTIDYNSNEGVNYCSNYQGDKQDCYSVLAPPNQESDCTTAVGNNKDCAQSITIGSAQQYPNAQIQLGYNLCTQVAYDSQGKPSCPAGSYVAYVDLDINHQENKIIFGKDTPAKIENYFNTAWQQPAQFIMSSTQFALPTAQNYASSGTPTLIYRGVNLSGFEAGCLTASKTCQYPINSYNYPTLTQEATPMGSAGFNTFRIPVRYEYLAKAGYVDAVAALIKAELAKGYYVVLDMHNYMVTCPAEQAGCQYTVPSAAAGTSMLGQLSADWQTLLNDLNQQDPSLLNNDHVLFDLMNEPQGVSAGDLVSNYETTIQAIRALGYKNNPILVEGINWAGLHDFSDSAVAFAQLLQQDPDVIINVHQYFDRNSSGTSATCIAVSQNGAEINMPTFLQWVHANKAKVMVTEFGMADNAQCQTDAKTFLNLIHANAYTADQGGFVGYTAWYAGHAYNNFNDIGAGGQANGLIGDVFTSTAAGHPYLCPTNQAGCIAR